MVNFAAAAYGHSLKLCLLEVAPHPDALLDEPGKRILVANAMISSK